MSGLWDTPSLADGIQAHCPYCEWLQAGEDWNTLAALFRDHLSTVHGVVVV